MAVCIFLTGDLSISMAGSWAISNELGGNVSTALNIGTSVQYVYKNNILHIYSILSFLTDFLKIHFFNLKPLEFTCIAPLVF